MWSGSAPIAAESSPTRATRRLSSRMRLSAGSSPAVMFLRFCPGTNLAGSRTNAGRPDFQAVRASENDAHDEQLLQSGRNDPIQTRQFLSAKVLGWVKWRACLCGSCEAADFSPLTTVPRTQRAIPVLFRDSKGDFRLWDEWQERRVGQRAIDSHPVEPASRGTAGGNCQIMAVSNGFRARTMTDRSRPSSTEAGTSSS